MEQDFDNFARHLEQQLLDVNNGDIGNVLENEAGQAPVTSTNLNTYSSNCSSEDQISLMNPGLQAEKEIQRVEMEQDFDNYAQYLEQQLLNVDGGGSINVSENKAKQAFVTFANPNNYSFNSCIDEEIEALLQDPDKYSQSINNDIMPQEALDLNQINCSTPQNHISPSNPSNVEVNQQSEVMTMTRTPTDVAANNAMPLRSSLHVPLMHQVEEPQSVSNVPMHQPQPIMHQFNSQSHHHSPNPTVQLSPQFPSSVPVVHMPLPMNHFNHQQNITPPAIPIASMPMTAGLVLHRTQPDHMSPAMTRLPQISSPIPFHHAPHYPTLQSHIVHSVPPVTHQYNQQNLSTVDQYNPQPQKHELPLPMTSLEFPSDVQWLSNGQHLVNHQPYSDLQAPVDVHTVINKGKQWSEEEHRLFLSGLQIYGKGNWKEISINVLKTRTPTQIASHAQKFFDRLENNKQNNEDDNNRARRRSSIHDITDPYVFAEPHHHLHQQQQHQNQMIVSHQNQFFPSSSLPIHHQLYYPQNPPNINNHNPFNL